MKIIKRKIHIKANIDHVFTYIRDFSHFHKELVKLNENRKIKIHLKDNTIEFKEKEIIFTLTECQPDTAYQLKALFTPITFHLKRFGKGYFTCTLSKSKNGTIMVAQAESIESPSFMWRIFIKIIGYILIFQSKSYEKEFISEIEQSA